MKNNNFEKLLFWFIVILLLAVLLIIPAAVNCFFLYSNFLTAENLSNKEWLGFWGSYLGSAFALVATLVIFLMTYWQNEKVNKDTKFQIKEQNRLSVLPMLKIKKIQGKMPEIVDYKIKNTFIDTPDVRGFYLKNIGQATAANIIFNDKAFESIEAGTSILIVWEFDPMQNKNLINISFNDLLGNQYYQSGCIIFNDKRQLELEHLSFPKIEPRQVNPS